MTLRISNRTGRPLSSTVFTLLYQADQALREALKLSPFAEISLSLVDNEEMKSLNNKYRGKNASTDVLSFSLLEEGEDPDQALLLGDVVISIPRAEEQARRYRHSLAREIILLFTHGSLHLLGYDHRTGAGEQEMQLLQQQILSSLNLECKQEE